MEKIYEFKKGETVRMDDEANFRKELLLGSAKWPSDCKANKSDNYQTFTVLKSFTITIELNYTEPE